MLMVVVMGVPSLAKADALEAYQQWADIKYNTLSDDQKKTELGALERRLETMLAKAPRDVNTKIVLATVQSTHASLIGGLSALPKIKSAKKLFEDAIKQDEKAMDGQAHAILGALYYGVPGWPIAFGDNDKAERHIKKALKISPDGIDANFFRADYLLERSKYDEAEAAFKHVISLKPRTENAAYKTADTGRLEEARLKRIVAAAKMKSGSGGKPAGHLND
jgi:tetratricopeptide (TPR) repeat protein|tara:strand:- start:999 stop:1661 length:663 start_codon:yes stop_codon:yes gene_type:complete